jgi:ABC-type multidrug transport system ATPase subunit/pSer/pThr/pTyr-binding forkhead associated (FHA) protein
MKSNSKLILRYRLGDSSWKELELSPGETLLGRTKECSLFLDDPLVSRHHAIILLENDHLWLTDLGSTNGTLLEGKHLTPNQRTRLRPGQVFSIGGFELEISAKSVPVEQAPRLQPEPTSTVQEQSHKPSTTQFKLRYQQGNQAWKEVALGEGTFQIGRLSGSDFFLDDDRVSRRHSQIEVSGNTLTLMDLGSTNGTQLESKPLSPHKPVPLLPGQKFTIGNCTLYVETTSGTTAVPVKPVTSVAPDVEAPRPAFVNIHLGAPESGEMQTIFTTDLPAAPLETQKLDLSKIERVTIGRASDNMVVINHPMVSRYHAVIDRIGTRYILRDLRSVNGVFVNNQRIERECWLKENDEIKIGPFGFSLSGNNFQSCLDTGLRIVVSDIKQRVSKKLNLLQDISLKIEPMEFVALVGMSGSGKTTLLNAISGFRPATDGVVQVNDTNLYQNYDLFRNDIGYVPQKDIVHAELTPEIALNFVARLRMPPDTGADEREQVVSEVLETLGLSERRNVLISRLSGGQLKRVSIGVELLTKPRLFFLDEPTSGLDPGTEADMMRLLRRLADQGRTVMLVTHATKNVMLCDKVIFLARGGYLAFFGAPDEALRYFDDFRTERERREKEMEFDDIYRILSEENRGRPKEWSERFRASPYYINTGASAVKAAPVSHAAKPAIKPKRVSSLRQFFILSARNLKILTQDKVSLGLMLALAPLIGLMDFIWGRNLYDPVKGDAAKILTMWFMAALITVLVGSMSSVREIVKEIDIYKRERAVNLKVAPYVLSKIWVGVVLAIYQAGMLWIAKLIFVRPHIPDASGYLAMYVTLFLGTLCGYLIGLAISAGAPNQNSALLLIIVVLVPQFLFAGALLPLNLIPGGEAISMIMPTRWVFESFIRITQMGDQLNTDPCWQLSKTERLKLDDSQKTNCPCMGQNVFTQCASFPGILSPDFYDQKAAAALAQPRPIEPAMPTAYPYPTALPSPTPLPTPTLMPSPTPLPTPDDMRLMSDYMDQRQIQGAEYQDSILSQFDQYRVDSQIQGQGYSSLRTQQGDEYADLRQEQGDQYSADMRAYGDQRAAWQETREKAISSAEALLGTIYDNYNHALGGGLTNRWLALIGINGFLLVAVLFFQKRKDVV